MVVCLLCMYYVYFLYQSFSLYAYYMALFILVGGCGRGEEVI